MSQVITIDDLTSYMTNTTVDAGLGQTVVDGVNAWIDTETGRLFGTTEQITERYDWANVVWLRHQDIISIDEMTLGWPGQTNSTIDPSGYYFNPLGRVTLYTWANGNMSRLYNDYLSIQYTYGVTTVPDDLKMAALGIAADMYNWATNGNRDVASVSVGSYRVEYTNKRTSAGSAPDQATSTADANWAVIQSHRLQRV